jgi:hypothetical protein
MFQALCYLAPTTSSSALEKYHISLLAKIAINDSRALFNPPSISSPLDLTPLKKLECVEVVSENTGDESPSTKALHLELALNKHITRIHRKPNIRALSTRRESDIIVIKERIKERLALLVAFTAWRELVTLRY